MCGCNACIPVRGTATPYDHNIPGLLRVDMKYFETPLDLRSYLHMNTKVLCAQYMPL